MLLIIMSNILNDMYPWFFDHNRYSGITKKILDPVTTTIQDVQRVFKEVIPNDAILVGHSLGTDLRALKVSYFCNENLSATTCNQFSD